MKKLGFRAQMLLSLALPILGIVAFFAVYFPAHQERDADLALGERARTMATVLARSLMGLVDLGLHTDIQRQFDATAGEPGLRYLAVVRPGHKVVAHVRAASVGDADELLEMSPDVRVVELHGLVHALAPIRKEDGTALGTLVLGFTRESITAARKDSLRTTLGVGGVVFIAAMLLGWLVTGTIAQPVRRAARRLGAVSGDLVAAGREQEASAAEGASAVEETRRTMEGLVSSAQQIAESCVAVLENAEHSLSGSHQIHERIAELSANSEKVAELLASIMQIADRTDLLALNAALEGTKAGEAGKGFTLVAGEMRRLAESVMESVNGIRRLMKDVRTASQGAVDASREATRLSEETTGSARQIALVTQQQRKATEQVSASMDEMTALLSHNMASVKQTTRSAGELAELAGNLSGLVGEKRDAPAGHEPPTTPRD